MDRRCFTRWLGTVAAAHPLLAAARQQEIRDQDTGTIPQETWREIEAGAQGRLGVAVLDTATGRLDGHRLDERFPMCSTFKWLAGAHVLRRVDEGRERLDRRVRFGPEALVPYSPVAEKHVGGDGMTLGELCEATITVSDNAAGNLVLESFGGPQGLTRYARSLGDTATRLDRWEPKLNEATPGDPRDTTTPRAMAQLLQATMLGDALSSPSRAQLVRWMQACKTNGQRLGAHLPPGWLLGSKTGTGARGTTNDVGVYWPRDGGAIVVVGYLTDTTAAEGVRNAAVARVGRAAIRAR
jgi:beta-lactamase class A